MARAAGFTGLGGPDVGLTAVNQPSRSKVPVPGSSLLLAGLSSLTDLPLLCSSRESLLEAGM